MKLLHQFVDIIPGRPGMRPTTAVLSENPVVPGSAIVRLVNTTDQENAYTLRLNCEETYWQDDWFTMVSLPPDLTKGDNAPPSGKPDVRGPQDRWVKLFVPRGGTRDVLIRFNVPQKAECRAKRYRYQIEAETQIVGPNVGTRLRDRVTILDGMVTVQPFYKWSLDIAPEDHRVSLLRRKAKYEIVVTNEGNDWLYCELKPGRRKELTLETPTIRAAVPPPEPGETITVSTDTEPRTGVQRTIPIRAVTKLKLLRGTVTPLPLPITAVRVDAPTVPHVFEDGTYSGSQAVVAVVTSEIVNPPMDRNLTYFPAFPSNVSDFFERTGSSIRGLLFTVIGGVAALVLGAAMYEIVFFNNISVEPTSLNVAVHGTLTIKGTCLQGARISIGTAGASGVAPNLHHWTVVNATPKISDWSECTIVVPDSFSDESSVDHQVIKVRAERAVQWFPFLKAVMPYTVSLSAVQVGAVQTTVVVKPPEITHLASGTIKPGQPISIVGTDLGTQGAVLFNNAGVNADSWTPTKVVATVPMGSMPGQLIIQLLPAGTTNPIPAGSVQVPIPPVTPTATTAGVVPGQPGAPGAAGGASAGSPPTPAATPIPTTTVVLPAAAAVIKPISVSSVKPKPIYVPPVKPVQTRPTVVQSQPTTRPVVSNSSPPPVTQSNAGANAAKQQMKQQIDTQQAQLKTEQASLNTMIAQRNALYQKVQQAQSSVNTSDQNSVNQYNALVAQANAENDKTTNATHAYETHVTTVNGMINQYDTMR